MRTAQRLPFARMFLIGNLALAGMLYATAGNACATLEEAARSALAEALPLSSEFEYGGALYVLDGCHGYTAPQTSGDPMHIELRVTLPAGARLAGIYHTHPGPHEQGREFSPHDVETQRELGVPSFIGFAAEMFMLDRSIERTRRGKNAQRGAMVGRRF